LKKNFCFGKVGEIDIIAEEGNSLVFIEVKYWKSRLYGDPLEAITTKKQNSLRKVAEAYLYINHIYNRECRFDVICIDIINERLEIRHFVNAF